uniref:Glutathione S-transferase domain protein n=1 Tax=Nonomuraea gerenzanensis TaxID=93944 RepID=A0A1M4EA93_9ACTN|nr:glutathione S-transferase domain protein [Nonomuraea gerenzanensis]
MGEPARGAALDGAAAADLARALGFLRGFARRRAPVVVPVPGGFGVLDARYPGSYDDNKLIVTASGGTDEGLAGRLLAAADEGLAQRLMAAADEVLSGREHRLVCVDDDRLGTACAPAFAAAGYEHETNLVMVFRGEPPHDSPPAERLGLEELAPVLRRDWRRTLPQAPDEVIDGLARRVSARLRGADTVAFRGVRAPSGEIAARADLYVHGGVAQIESVFTGHEHRGRGYAGALMRALLAEVAGAELIFLLADADDWPRHFYERLGFAEVGRTHAFLRT